MTEKTRILISSDYLLDRLRNIRFVPDEYTEVECIGDKIIVKDVQIEAGHSFSKMDSKYQVREDSFNSLVRLLKTIHDQPITVQFGPDSVITLRDIIV